MLACYHEHWKRHTLLYVYAICFFFFPLTTTVLFYQIVFEKKKKQVISDIHRPIESAKSNDIDNPEFYEAGLPVVSFKLRFFCEKIFFENVFFYIYLSKRDL